MCPQTNEGTEPTQDGFVTSTFAACWQGPSLIKICLTGQKTRCQAPTRRLPVRHATSTICVSGPVSFHNSVSMADQLPLNGAFWFDGLDQLGPQLGPDASMLNLEFLDDINQPLSAMPAPQQAASGATGAPKRRGGRRPLTAEEKAARAEKEKEQNRIMQVL